MSAYYGEPDNYEDILYSFADAEDDDCQHKSIVEVPGGTDCEDCPKTWRHDDAMAESFFDSDDMYGSLK